MRNKNLLELIILTGMLLILATTFASAADFANISVVSFSADGNTVTTNGSFLAFSNETTVSVGFIVRNFTTLAGANISYSLDNGAYKTVCNSSAGLTRLTQMVNANVSGCVVNNASTTNTQATVNYLYLNVTEGKHVIVINVTLDEATSNAASTNETGGDPNATFYINNFKSLAWGATVRADWENLSASQIPISVAFNSKFVKNITIQVYNFTTTLLVYNVTFGMGASDVAGADGVRNDTKTASYNWTVSVSNWYTYNVTLIASNNMSLTGYYNWSIVRHIVLDNVAPNTSAVSCTGWKSATDATVEKDATFTCSCSSAENNDTVATYIWTPSSSPSTSVLGLFGVTCHRKDSAGNNGTSTTLTYTVKDVDVSASSGTSASTTPKGATIVIAEPQFTAGYTQALSANDKFQVTFKPSAATVLETHTIQVSSVGTDSATIIISSNPITLVLNIGGEKKVDIDGDGTYDVSVKLNKITDGKGDFTVKKISEPIPASETGPVSGGTGLEEEATTEETPSGGISSRTLWIIAVVVVVIIAVVLVSMTKKKKK
ncbi:MAG: hypothetical protein KKA64_04380 [Nanoarchaeota archaeon]|nr:hypothetical protein [Nanoarchaeota archaeon]